MAMEYQGFATLGVNLNRQKYGPLDVSSVFTSTADLTYYRTKGQVIEDNLSDYWKVIVPYPYEGQLISLVENGIVSILKLVANGDIFEATPVVDSIELPENLATQDYVQEEINKIEIPSLDEYATKEYVDNKIAEIEVNSGEGVLVEALTEQEILDILAASNGNTIDIEGNRLVAMTENEVKEITSNI